MSNRDFLYLVLIAVSWILFWGMVAGLIWFGITARIESDRCVASYEKYLEETIANCTIDLGLKDGEVGIPMNFTWSPNKKFV